MYFLGLNDIFPIVKNISKINNNHKIFFKRQLCRFLAQVCLLLPLVLFLTQCSNSGKNNERLLIATAANMQFAISELSEQFTRETGIACETIVSSSGKLTAQIMAGAPYDFFVSADMSYPETLFKEGFTKNTPKIYAFGHLVVWTLQDLALDDLTSLEPRHVALANPETAPYGKAAQEAMAALGIDSLWQDQLVYGESIAQVNQFVSTGAATFGFTAKAVVMSPDLASTGKWVAVADSLYTPIAQGAVVLNGDESKSLKAAKFYEFLFSESAKQILHKFGYTPAEQ